nr:recombinase family protein [Mariprofundus sp. KV]
MGGIPPIGYIPHERTLQVEPKQAEKVQSIFQLYLELKFVSALKEKLDAMSWVTPVRFTRKEKQVGGKPFSRGHLYRILRNPIYIGKIVHKDKRYNGNHPAIINEEIWDAVQALLDENHISHKSRKRAAHPSLLTGLLFDEHGNKLTPSHTTKGKRRYRYYILQHPIDGSLVGQPALRVPAQELERTVITSLAGFLNDKARLLELIGMKDAAETQRVLKQATQHAEALTKSTASDRVELLNRLVMRIELYQDKLIIIINSKALLVTKTSDSIELVVPVELKRCGMAMKLVVRAPASSETRAPDLKLLALIAKGNQWFTKLISGQCDSVQQVAQEVGVSSSYCTRLIYLSFLDPSIIQLLLDGKQPPELNADQLKRCVPLPVDWSEQHKLLGFEKRF